MKLALNPLLMAILFFSVCAQAEETVSLAKEAGKALIVTLDANREIEVFEQRQVLVMNTKITLSDNSCTKKLDVKGQIHIPFIAQSFIGVWKKHPQFKGQVVLDLDSDTKVNQVYERTITIGAFHRAFDAKLGTLKNINTEAIQTLKVTRSQPEIFGWVDCGKSCTGLLPESPGAVTWDENFETENSELTIARSESSMPSVNQMTARLTNVPMKIAGSRILFFKPAQNYGSTQNIPAGISYQLQWTFHSPNLFDPIDEYCQLKWDEDFGAIFTQFTSITANVRDPQKINLKNFEPYLYDPQDENISELKSLFDAQYWISDSVIK